MIAIRQSDSKRNPAFAKPWEPTPLIKKTRRASSSSAATSTPAKAEVTASNLSWLRAKAAEVSAKTTEPLTWLVLVGGSGAAHVRLRMAQAHLRNDMTPGHWSHVLLCTDPKFVRAREINVAPPIAWNFPPASNGVINGFLKSYDDVEEFPNIALIGVPVDPQKVSEAADNFWKLRRDGLDAVEMMHRWLGFLWGVEGSPNPLTEGHGIPSSALVDFALAAVSYDLTPALNSRSSCPEAIWQSALWWQGYHTSGKKPGLTGGYLVRSRLVP